MPFTLLVKGGEVVDPAGGNRGLLDVAVRGSRIAALDADIPAESAERVIDASGSIVTPGWVDLHTHIYSGVGRNSVDPMAVAWRTGVTTWVDAGTAGAYTWAGFRDYVVPRVPLNIRAFLNMSLIGILIGSGELADRLYLDPSVTRSVALANLDRIVGIKVRIDRDTVGPLGLEPLQLARNLADETGLRLMMHIGHGPPTAADVLPFLGEGDILTHCLTGLSMKVVDDAGRLLRCLLEAKERGVFFDVGHGVGSFTWDTAEAWAAAGLMPDVISSDIHADSIQESMQDLPTCLTKLLAVGMSFEDALQAVTGTPARLAGTGDLGRLLVGGPADIAIFRWTDDPTPLWDSSHVERTAERALKNVLTIASGHVLDPRLPELPAPWVEATEARAALTQRLADEVRHASLPADSLPEGFGVPEPIR